MTEENTGFSIFEYIDIALRRKWLVILPVLVILPASIALCFLLPKMYETETTIMIIPQKVPDSFVKSTVTMNPSEYLTVISQEILSRTRLEKIIRETSPDLVDKVPLENMVNQMRANTTIDVEYKRDRSVAAFTITHQGKDPYIITESANLMASLFIEESLKSRKQQAQKTTEFLSSELAILKKKLEEQEGILSEFKQRYMGSLPEQRDANLRMLDQLNMQRQRITDEINNTENQKIMIQQQLLSADATLPLSINNQSPSSGGSLQARILALRNKIADLQNRYTAEHPDVVSAQSELEKLMAQPDTSESGAQNGSLPYAVSGIDQQVLSLNLKINSLRNEDLLIKGKIADYQARIEMTPKIEQELFSINRDYENTQKAYDELTKKRMDAEQAEKLEIDQQGEQFKIIDAAKVPTKPFKSNPPKIVLMGLMLALCAGGGLVFVAEFLDQSFYSVKDLESFLELPVLISIPAMTEKNQQRFNLVK